MTNYEKELQTLKFWDDIQTTRYIGRGYHKIDTAGHGYLIVPKRDLFANIAKEFATFTGKLAYYLEEDCDMPAFINKLPA